MKFVRFKGGKTGLVIKTDTLQVLDIGNSLPRLRAHNAAAAESIEQVLFADPAQSWVPMIGRWDEVRGAFAILEKLASNQSAVEGIQLQPFAGMALEAPLASPNVHIFAMGSNTTDHIIRAFKVMQNLDLTHEQARKAKDDGLPPFGFMLWPATVVGPDATVAPPRSTLKFDYEGECAVYVKHGGRNLETVELWGYTAFNDFGVRDPFLKLAKEAGWGPFSLNLPKNFDTSNSCGPWVVVDEGSEITKLRCRLTVNGELRQDWTLSEMIYSFDETLAYISKSLTLRPGDMLASGTGAGVALESGVDGSAWLKPGDLIEVTLDGVAPLRNAVGAW